MKQKDKKSNRGGARSGAGRPKIPNPKRTKAIRVPIEILHLGHATDISISNNNIEFIPAEVGNLTNLTSLKMNKNVLIEEFGLGRKSRIWLNG